MEIALLNKEFVVISILDTFESVIWTERYSEAGDFEISVPASKDMLNTIENGFYLIYKESDRMMIIESIEINCDVENGNKLIFKGRSLESILDRRIIWEQTIISGNLQNAIKKLLDDAIISPAIANRRISNFIFKASTDPAVTSITIDETQFTGDGLYDVIKSLCEQNKLGFKIIPDSNNNFVFSLYSGVDRSYNQTVNPYVVFSKNFENIIDSDYMVSTQNYKTITLVAGEGEGSERKTATYGSGAGLERREMYTDARDISSTVDEGTIPLEEYMAQLEQRGKANLDSCIIEKAFDGQVEPNVTFKYNEDFFLGDIVYVVSEYDNGSNARVTELIRSESTSGYEVYPTFKMLDGEELPDSQFTLSRTI